MLIGKDKRWREVIYLCCEIKKLYNCNPNIELLVFQIQEASTNNFRHVQLQILALKGSGDLGESVKK